MDINKKNMKISLFDKFLIGGLDPLEFENKDDALFIFQTWIESKNFEKNVFVAFLTWKNADNYRDEQSSFLVTHSKDTLSTFLIDTLNYDNWNDLHLVVLEFPSYQDAFNYCKDLKESF